ncbi:MAG: hypothetical protein KatS3mg115_2434 [Candidatus Poribacteria bacterium]|nr:MAG: hypothetical protein KatS3mg115_2434 [Candidatus Poribacteria bacterium]
MASRTSVPLEENASYTFEVGLYPQRVEPLALPYRPGWNLISLPGEVLSGMEALNSSAVSAYAWDPVAQSWTSQPLPLDSSSLTPVSGALFVKADSTAPGSASVNVEVENPHWREVWVTLHPGWNLIGAPWSQNNDVPVLMVTSQLTSQTLITWDATQGFYVPVSDFLTAGAGYWVYNDTESLLTVPLVQSRDWLVAGETSQVMIHASPRTESGFEWRLPLRLETADGQVQGVELIVASGAQEGFDSLDVPLPPSPPERSALQLWVQVPEKVGRLLRSAVPPERARWELRVHPLDRRSCDGRFRRVRKASSCCSTPPLGRWR